MCAANQPISLNDAPLDTLELSIRAYNCLRRAGLRTVAGVAALTDEQLLGIRNLGVGALAEIHEKLTIYLDSLPRTEQLQKPAMPFPSRPQPQSQYHTDNTPIDMLMLSVRPRRALMRHGIITIGQLAQLSSGQIADVGNIGKKSLTEIEKKLKAYLAEHSLSPPEPVEPESSSPWVDPVLLAHAAQVECYLTWLGEQGKATWATSSVTAPQSASIKVLGLSTRAHNALIRAGVTTVGQLAQMSPEQILNVRNVGGKSLVEIEKKLEAYLAEHLLPPTGQTTPIESAPTIPVKPDPPFPLADPALLARAAQVPLSDISVERLALPVRWRNQLHRLGIESVGELARQTADVFGYDSPVGERLNRYLTWLVKQGEATWFDEVAGQDISPLHRLALAETTLDDLVERWLDALQQQKPWSFAESTNRNRDQQVICWRFGLDGERLKLEEVGERLNVTRERIRQIQIHALSILSRPHSRAVVRPLMELLIYWLEQAGGLMNEAQVEAALRQELVVGDIDPIGVAHLVFEINDDVKRLRGTKVWGLKSAPLDELTGVQTRFVQTLEKEHTLLPVDKVIARLKDTRFYRNRQDTLQDSFIAACLRVHPDILVDKDNLCGLERWERHRTGEIILTLREIGDPEHYAVIAEKTNALLEPEMRTSTHNIHAILGRRTDLFVRVGHGVFGLKEWGLPDDGSVANAAYRVLTEAGKPLHIETITDHVLETWRVQPTSVSAAVELDDRFVKIGHGVYWLRERVTEEVETGKIADFGDLFGARLERWQKDWDHRQGNVELDTQAEVDTIRRIGLDFFND